MLGFLKFRQTTVLHDGSGNVIVQIQGNHNRVVTGAASPHLALTRFEAHRQARTELERLSPYARSVPLLGREEELAELRSFCAPAAQAVAVRVLVGAGGGGKTRLALSLCETLAAEGWATGFATGRELERFAQQQNVSAWGWRGPTLVVVDDAASNTHGLAIWIEQLAQRPRSDGPPLRVLLLEREARVEEGWWPKVFAPGGWDESGRQALLYPREPWPLRSLPGPAQTALVRHVQQWGVNGPASPPMVAQRPARGWWHKFWGRWRQRKLQAAPPPSPEMTEQDAALLAHLRSWGVDEPLFLMMSALQEGATLSRAALALRVARREADRLNAVAQAEELDAGLLRHWVACITLAQGLDEATLLPLIEAEKAALALPSAGDAGQWLRVLRQVLPPTPAEALAPMGPDWIGQAFLLVAWPPNEAVGAQTVRRCRGRLGARVLPVLVACVQNFAAETPGVMPWLQALVDEAQAGTLADLLALDDVLPSGSGILANVALDVAWAMHAKLVPEQAAAPEQADVLRRLALALSNVGQRDEALNYARQAETLYHELAQHNPQAFRPVWAMSLGTLATMLSNVGQRDEALGCACQAESLYRKLAQHNPQAFRPDWATSLNNLATMLSEVDQRAKALGCARQAESLYRELVQQNPLAFLPDWASSLSNLAAMLSNVGRLAEALSCARQAESLYRELAQQNPQAFRSVRAMSLTNLANMLHNVGERDEALGYAHQAESIWRELAQCNSQAVRSAWAVSLNNLATMLSDVGQRAEALDCAHQAECIQRELAQQNPQAHHPDWAASLNNLAAMLRDVGQGNEALGYARQAEAIRRELAQQNPQAFRPDWAISLNNLASILRDVAQRDEALGCARQAESLYRELAQQNPQAFYPTWARSLHNLAAMLLGVGQQDEALGCARQAESLYRELAQHNPQAFRPDWATSLNNLANMLREVGQRDEALACARQAEALYRELAQHNPQAFRPGWAMSLGTLANRLSEVGQRDEALACARQAEALRRELAQHNPLAFRPDWAKSLNTLAIHLAHAGERASALATAEKALNLYEQLAKQWPDAFAENVKTTQQLYQALGGLVIQLPRPAPKPTATPPVRHSAASFHTPAIWPSPTPRWTSGVITMLDLAAITALASTAVTLLTPLLEKIAEGGAQELGTSAIKELVDKFKRCFSQPKTQEALDDLAQQPTDADAQAVLRQALKKAMSADPSLAAALQQWIQDAQPQAATQPGIHQTINASGDHNKNVQIVGSGNSVS